MLWMLSLPLSNFKMVDIPFLLALGPPCRSHAQQSNPKNEHSAYKLFYLSYSQICHTEHCAAWKHLSVWHQQSAMLSHLPKLEPIIYPGRESWTTGMISDTFLPTLSGDRNTWAHKCSIEMLKRWHLYWHQPRKPRFKTAWFLFLLWLLSQEILS